MDARLRFQFLLSVLLVVLFIEFYSKVGPEVALDFIFPYNKFGPQKGNLSDKSETEQESRRKEKCKHDLMRTLRQLQASQVFL